MDDGATSPTHLPCPFRIHATPMVQLVLSISPASTFLQPCLACLAEPDRPLSPRRCPLSLMCIHTSVSRQDNLPNVVITNRSYTSRPLHAIGRSARAPPPARWARRYPAPYLNHPQIGPGSVVAVAVDSIFCSRVSTLFRMLGFKLTFDKEKRSMAALSWELD
ncbi:hypothetical protein BKA81DRAFT_62229 [Phyllosticta paracitricarpa]